MKKIVTLLLLSLMVLFMACPGPGIGPGNGEEEPDGLVITEEDRLAAQQRSSAAMDLFLANDYDGAAAAFVEAYAYDPTNGQAVLGYSVSGMIGILKDPAFTGMMASLGLTDYPQSANELVTLMTTQPIVSSTTETDEYGSTVTYYHYDYTPVLALFPKFNQVVYSDISTYMMDLGEHLIKTQKGADPVVTALSTVLGDRLDSIIAALNLAADNASTFQLVKEDVTSHMTAEELKDFTWPTYPNETDPNSPGEDVVFSVGSAEVKMLASQLLILRAQVRMLTMYSFDLTQADDLSAYWDDASGTISFVTPEGANLDESVLLSILKAKPEASSILETAKAESIAALTMQSSSIGDILARPADSSYFLNRSFSLLSGMAESLSLTKQISDKVLDSFQNSTPLHFMALPVMTVEEPADPNAPVEDASTFPTIDDIFLPASVEGAMTVRLGEFYSNPITFFGSNGVLQTTAEGEPEFYRKDTLGNYIVLDKAFLDENYVLRTETTGEIIFIDGLADLCVYAKVTPPAGISINFPAGLEDSDYMTVVGSSYYLNLGNVDAEYLAAFYDAGTQVALEADLAVTPVEYRTVDPLSVYNVAIMVMMNGLGSPVVEEPAPTPAP